MTRDELLYQLRTLELQLLDHKVDEFMKEQDEKTRQRFVAAALELRILVTRLTTAKLSDIADKLEDLSEELEEGITKLKKTIKELKKAVEIINLVTDVLGYVARVVAAPLP